MSASEDEFDDVPDDLCKAEGVDWDQILSLPPPPPTVSSQVTIEHEARPIIAPSPSSSTQYSFDDDLDSSFFAELDDLEQDFVQSQRGQATITIVGPAVNREDARSSDLSSLSQLESLSPSKSPSRKRVRESSLLQVPNKKGKSRTNENERVLHALSGIEDELNCPICSDIFAAAHLCNPCGHSVCGECGWQWKKRGKTNCAICRTELARDNPMIPNFSMDNTVEKHVAALGQSGIDEWKIGGTKYAEWCSRKERWAKNAAERANATTMVNRRNETILVWEILSDEELSGIEDLQPRPRIVRPRPM
ncbi:hypothetical protein H0H93_015906 [Arthromyces matolae]|nr:hypothetical protein H0H93_015906 [Arthromyces matolae]